jgi:mRNA interferase HigB
MHVISQKSLRKFWMEYPDSEAPLRAWYKIAEHADWQNFAEVKRACSNSVDQVGRYTVFDIGGNKYRLVVHIRFEWRRVFVHSVMTHKEYDRGLWK